MAGVPPSGSGSRASHEAAKASPPKASIPNADERRRKAITDWWARQGIRDFIRRVKSERTGA
jgi:hypothetical protein